MDRLFIPLKREYFAAFSMGDKNTEYRRYGARWNEKTCRVGRAVTISLGYGKGMRLHGWVTGFRKRRMASKSWLACYGKPGVAACIRIHLNPACGKHYYLLADEMCTCSGGK
jgi:hypothetical protein